MDCPRLSWLTTLLASLVLAAPPSARADEAENWKRLLAMPREQRLDLARNLEAFDELPAAEKAAVRDLDAAIARLDPAVQARYRVVLRRYHVWVKGLSDERKKELAEAGSLDRKLTLVTRWHKEDRVADRRAEANLVLQVHPGDLGTIPPFEMANALRVWSKLDPAERARIEALTPIHRRFDELRKHGLKNRQTLRFFPPADEAAMLADLQADGRVAAVFPRWVEKQQKKADGKEIEAKRAGTENPLHHLAESLYFIKHPPHPVREAELIRFEREVPNWLRASLDPLPPEDARRRLTILYRQIYPFPDEIPLPPKADPAKAKAPAAPPAPKPNAPRVDL